MVVKWLTKGRDPPTAVSLDLNQESAQYNLHGLLGRITGTVDGSHFHLEDVKQLCDTGLNSSPELLAA